MSQRSSPTSIAISTSPSGRPVASVFFGGGTPSLFGAGAIASLLDGFSARLPVLPDAEVTMEANPGTIEHGRFAGYAQAGINRVSLGAQSFDADRLRMLGRIHGPAEIGVAVAELAEAGIANFNLDLMYALPEQTRDAALADLEAAIALRPAHLSHYQLTLEPGTAFFHRPPPLPDDELSWQMQLDCQERLAAAGFAHYEVSAYAQPGRQCRHNLNYWRFGDYLGIGAGAHGKVTVDGKVVRTEKPRSPRAYLEAGGRAGSRHEVETGELPFEFMLNALRLTEGFPPRTSNARPACLPTSCVRRWPISLHVACSRPTPAAFGRPPWVSASSMTSWRHSCPTETGSSRPPSSARPAIAGPSGY